ALPNLSISGFCGVASIARNLGFSQTSYFCKVFRQTYQVTPQAFRQQINAGSQTESF
ncbi:AraC family transcriptional regulator, partial [Klebsiella pneumoniae]